MTEIKQQFSSKNLKNIWNISENKDNQMNKAFNNNH